VENRSFLIHGDIHTKGDVLDDTILADTAVCRLVRYNYCSKLF
jgi:hypothetical protein